MPGGSNNNALLNSASHNNAELYSTAPGETSLSLTARDGAIQDDNSRRFGIHNDAML